MPGDCSASGLPKQAPALGRGVADYYRNYAYIEIMHALLSKSNNAKRMGAAAVWA